MRVRLIPGTATAGGTRTFEVASATFSTAKGELTLKGRDGKICLGLVGLWEVSFVPSERLPMSVDEIERLHEGRALVVVN